MDRDTQTLTLQLELPEGADVSGVEGLLLNPEQSAMLLRMLGACASAEPTPDNVVPFRMPAGVP